MICPVCNKKVNKFKTNCHVIPRSFVRNTKVNGRNILINFKGNEISLNQSDYADDFWCEDCENESARIDGYGASVLLQKTKGRITEGQGTKISWKHLSGLDYENFRKFLISIPIRDHLARKDKILSASEFEILRANYLGTKDDILVLGYYIADGDPLAGMIHRPVKTKSGNGVNFQLFNFCFYILMKDIHPSLVRVSLKKPDEIYLSIITAAQTGSLKNMQSLFRKAINDPKNANQLQKIERNLKSIGRKNKGQKK